MKYYSSEHDEYRSAYLIGEVESDKDVYFAYDPGVEEDGSCGCLLIIEELIKGYQDSNEYSLLYLNDNDGKLMKMFDLPPETPPEPKEKEAVELLIKLGYKVSR